MRVTFILAILAWPIGSVTAQAPKAVVVTPDAMQWGPAPAILPAGAKLAVLDGDPTKPGLFTMRLSMPDGYRIPPHFHPVDEHVTVI
ncbi:MAG TPA: cupin domain-containing protein, partial [Gemmatimonadales bacterium]|nr:cupin domain-containing protein [Gemmatimonadales bacterium]